MSPFLLGFGILPASLSVDFARDRHGLPNFIFPQPVFVVYFYHFFLVLRGFWPSPPSFVNIFSLFVIILRTGRR